MNNKGFAISIDQNHDLFTMVDFPLEWSQIGHQILGTILEFTKY